MAAINNSINLTDRMSPVLKTVMKALDSTLKALDRVDRASNHGMNIAAFRQASADIRAANDAVNSLNRGLSTTGNLLDIISQLSNKASSSLSGVASRVNSGFKIRGQSLFDRSFHNLQTNRMMGKSSLMPRLGMMGGTALKALGSLTSAPIKGLSLLTKGVGGVTSALSFMGKMAISSFNSIADRGRLAYTETLSFIRLVQQGIAMIGSMMSYGDKVTSDLAKISLFNFDENTSDAQAYGMVYQAAQNSRGNLSDTTQLVNRIMMSGVYGEEAGSFGAATRMAETLNKALTVSGGTSEENSRALLQLSQALSSGVLQGDELRSIREQAPYLARVLAEGLGKIDDKFIGTTIGDLKDLGAAGELTSDVVIKAFEAMQNEVDTVFEDKAPKTWGQGIDSINNTIQVMLGYLKEMEGGPLEKISGLVWQIADYLQSAEGIQLIAMIAAGLGVLGGILSWVVQLALSGISWLVNHSYVLIAILIVLAGVLISTAVSAFVSWVAAVWPLLLVIAVIATIIYILNQLGFTFAEIAGGICGGIMVVIAFFKNLGLAIWGIIKGVWAVLSGFVTNVGLSFQNVGLGIKSFFAGILSNVLGFIADIAEALNKLPFVEFDYSGISNAAQSWADTKAQAEGDIEANKAAMVDLGQAFSDAYNSVGAFQDGWASDAFDSGYNFGYDAISGISDDIGSFTEGLTDFMNGNGDLYDNIGNLDKIGTDGVNVNGGNLDSVGSIKSDVNLNDEDIQLLRDMTARDYLLNLQQITPVAHIKFGDVRETADVNKIMDVIEDMVEEQMATALVEN